MDGVSTDDHTLSHRNGLYIVQRVCKSLPGDPRFRACRLDRDGEGLVATDNYALPHAYLLPGTENGDDAVTLDEDEDGGVGRHLDGVIVAVTASSAR